MPSSTPVLGFEGYIYVGEVGTAISELTELKECNQLNFSMGFGEVDATMQGDHGIKSYKKGLQDFSVGFSLLLLDTQSEEGTIVLNAIRSRTPIQIHVVNALSGDGPYGSFYVFGSDVSIDGENLEAISCTCRPAAGYGVPVITQRTNGGT
ncbi:MAG: hypothetical protein Q4D98_03030 [Planctomycetia bacterium]|nr:hypothetical protein [Planctomycetia bacterium]